MMIEVGRYQVTQLNDGRWVLQFLEGSNRVSLLIPSLDAILDHVVEHHPVIQCANLFRLAFTDPQRFVDAPEAKRMVGHFAELETPPGQALSGEALYGWHLQDFVNTFNNVFGQCLTLQEVDPMVKDLATTF